MKTKKLSPVFIFAFLFLANLSVSNGAPDVTDGKRAFLYAENLALNGRLGLALDLPSAETPVFQSHSIRSMNTSLQIVAERSYNNLGPHDIPREEYIERFREQNHGEFYYQVPLALPVLAAPLYLVSEAIGATPIEFVPLYLNSIIIAALGTVMFATGRELFGSGKIGFVLALMFGLTTFMWPYVSTMFSRPLALLFLFLGLYLVLYGRRRGGVLFPMLAGASIGLSYVAHPYMVILAPAMIAFGILRFRKNRKQIMALVIISLVMVGFMAFLNHYRFGSADDFGWEGKEIQNHVRYTLRDPPFSNPDQSYSFLSSPTQSMLLYVPLVILHPLGLYYACRRDRGLALLLIYLSLVNYSMVSTMTAGNVLGNGWGVHRYMLPIIPGIVISTGFIIARFSYSLKAVIPVVSIACAGFYVNLHGALVYFLWQNEYLARHLHLTDIDRAVHSLEYSRLPVIHRMLEDEYIYSNTGCHISTYYYCEYGIPAILVFAVLLSLAGLLALHSLGILNLSAPPLRRIYGGS